MGRIYSVFINAENYDEVTPKESQVRSIEYVSTSVQTRTPLNFNCGI